MRHSRGFAREFTGIERNLSEFVGTPHLLFSTIQGTFHIFASPVSEAWGPPQFQEKRSRSERAILGALGEFRGILGAALGIGNSILGIRNSILGMASHDLINTKPTILGATLGAIPGIAANPPERFSFAPAFSERFFKNWGGPRAPDCGLTSRTPSGHLFQNGDGQKAHPQSLSSSMRQ